MTAEDVHRIFGPPRIAEPRKRQASRRPIQAPIVLPLPPPDPRRLADADRLAAIEAAMTDPTLPDHVFRGLVLMWAWADAYGVYRTSASAIGPALGRTERRGRDIARLLGDRSYAIRRPDGFWQMQTPSVEGVSGRPAAAVAQQPESGRPAAGKRSPSSRTPPPYGGGGGRAPFSKSGAPPTPRRRREPKRVQCDTCDSLGWLQLKGPVGLSRCPDCNPGPPVNP